MVRSTRQHFIQDWGNELAGLARTPLVTGSGRGSVFRVDHPKGPLIERLYRHGGLRRLFFPLLFIKTDRAAREYAIHRDLFQQGLPTCEPVGWLERPTFFPFFRRYAFYTRFVDNARTAPELIRSGPVPHQLLEQAVEILDRLQRAGVFHPDLNLNNWLVSGDRLLLIDFDKAAATDQDRLVFLNACMKRMIRSARKLGFLDRKRLFFRFLILAARRFATEPRVLLNRLPAALFKRRFYHSWLWRLSGGHRSR